MSEPDVAVAYPYETIEPDDVASAARAVAQRIVVEGIKEVVIGLPLHMDGTESQSARRARQLAAELEVLTAARVVLWDERLSTKAAERSFSEIGVPIKKSRKNIDQSAAVWILQSYLDSKKENQWYEMQNPPVEHGVNGKWPKGKKDRRGPRRRR